MNSGGGSWVLVPNPPALPPPPSTSATLASLIAEEHFNIFWLLAILFPVLTAIVGSAGLYAYRLRCIKQHHKAMALRNAQAALETGEDDAAAIFKREPGTSSYLFTTKLPPEMSVAAEGGIDMSSWLSTDLESGLPADDPASVASLLTEPTAFLLPRRRSGGKSHLSAEVELAPR